jgi:tRNA pseudouridine55 synthase
LKKKLNPIDGVLIIDKPEGPTSHHIVAQIKRLLSPERIGHLGTLDPFASGLLPIMLGGATKLADEAMEASKGYLFRISLGIETDTLDPSGQTTKTSDFRVTSVEKVSLALSKFVGKIRQVPPAYSALKKDGRPLYEYMRAEGKLPFDLEEKARFVEVFEMNLRTFSEEMQFIDLEVICAKGTYVRCLARDIANELGTVGHCSQLRRHRVGHWLTEQSYTVPGQSLSEIDLLSHLQPAHNIAPELRVFKCIDANVHQRLLSGNPLTISDFQRSIQLASHVENTFETNQTEEIPMTGFGKCIFEGLYGLQYLAEYSIVDSTFELRPRKKIQSSAQGEVF